MVDVEDVKDCRVVLRVDFNVPVNQEGLITDFSRIAVVLPTINLLLKNGCAILLLSHFGKPTAAIKEKFSFERIIGQICQFTGLDIRVVSDLSNELLLRQGEIILLENVRFFAGEVENDSKFAMLIARHGDVYVNDAFSVSHREHASVVGIPQFLPSAMGLAFLREYQELDSAATKGTVAVIGGSKISTKLPLIRGLLKKVKMVILGGALVNVILRSRGYNVGKSMCEDCHCDITLPELFIPFDFVTSHGVEDQNFHFTDARMIPHNEMILDIGPASLIAMKGILSKAEKILWNGPIGAFEFEPFCSGTHELARFISFLTKNANIKSIIGGGDTLAAIKSLQEPCFSYISTSGGAFLKFQEEGTLPGIEAIKKCKV
ncbi:phosphoglycerate kinase [Neorickettsia sennetsu]|uniref:Phosphoglycerate kinase n=1 Tax=Ehrlichia sennetsu (strain ATCC VR-367 / Miyayama) TaxID=222891 RepID=Q2GDX5_EHRS3|nr:phosphoglycerate kinase [Neorickettsia sennetsu]ABD46454.1 phosphoglycerate kinase [Neorickettsia sennetsu str. Miyayama]